MGHPLYVKGRANKTMDPTPFAAGPLRVPSPRKRRVARRGSSLNRYAASILQMSTPVANLGDRMNRQWSLVISAFVLVLGIRSHLGAQRGPAITPEMAQRIDALFAQWDNTRSPGCALGVSQSGNLVYARGYGMSNLEYDIPITPDSVFDTGSVSKQFTAFSIALLATEGKLSLDDDVRQYLAELPDYGHRITIRQLLTHTS